METASRRLRLNGAAKYVNKLTIANGQPAITRRCGSVPVPVNSLSASIAAASVLAKVSRDHCMLELAREYPQYQFEKHKGYGTKLHYELLRAYGPSPIHRRTFLKNL